MLENAFISFPAFVIVVYETHLNFGLWVKTSRLSVSFLDIFFWGSYSRATCLSWKIRSPQEVCLLTKFNDFSITVSLFSDKIKGSSSFQKLLPTWRFYYKPKYFQPNEGKSCCHLLTVSSSCFIWLFERKPVITLGLVCISTESRFFLRGRPEQWGIWTLIGLLL